jgi:hypothetical protein
MSLISIFTSLLLMSACIRVTPHENFKNFLTQAVGTSINNREAYDVGAKENLLKSVPMKNGNRLNEYIYKNPNGVCIYAFEVDSADKIVGWRLFEDQAACSVAP